MIQIIEPSSYKVEMFSKQTFVGRVKVYENRRYLWSESCGIHRLNQADALEDAHKLAKELQAS